MQDQSIADAKVVIDLIDAIKPGTINYELVKEGGTDEVSCVFVWHMVNNELGQLPRHFYVLHLSLESTSSLDSFVCCVRFGS
jgi:hypothetical protein